MSKMIHEVIPLAKGKEVTLITHIHDQSEQGKFQIEKRHAIIIMPGGAYSFLSDTEGELVALTFLKEHVWRLCLIPNGILMAWRNGWALLRKTSSPMLVSL